MAARTASPPPAPVPAATPAPDHSPDAAPDRPGWERLLPARRTALMGVLNVTPDSFSDGGNFFHPQQAVAHALELATHGADLLDLGGESTRPGARPVDVDEEIRRVVPVIQALRAAGVSLPISIDTTKAAVARAAIAAGADAVNDVSAFTLDPEMAATCAELEVPVVLMHMRGEPRTMQDHPEYHNVVGEVADYLEGRVRAAIAAGIRRDRIALDPGLGFGKDTTHNLLLLKGLSQLTRTGLPVVVGSSRKSFIGRILEQPDPARREWGTAATVAWAIAHGARVVRVHAVREMTQVTRVIDAIRNA
ncbi:MAG: dihydropteroate synthase [Nitrospirota bacterium]|nr:dihydropteroate synthase [Nitrospirota bacterium]